MENLNANEIIKAMECCYTPLASDCNDCGYRGQSVENGDYISCSNRLMADALTLIKQLTEENERLRAENVDCRLGFTLLEDAFQRLEKINEQTKSDTVRQMQERIKEYFPYDADSGLYVVLDQIAKELISDE